MSKNTSSLRIGIYGASDTPGQPGRSFGVWTSGYESALTAANATPVTLRLLPGCSWDEVLDEVDGVVFAGSQANSPRFQAQEERLCEWCRELGLPLLAIDHGMHVLNTTFGGTVHEDVAREMPEALQHRHPPEPGVRHAILVTGGTHLAEFYGEGEIVVNSEHRRAINRVAKGFQVSARALDGVIEAIETGAAELDGWFGLGVQWHPASATASGLDIQLFRGLVDECARRHSRHGRTAHVVAA